MRMLLVLLWLRSRLTAKPPGPELRQTETAERWLRSHELRPPT
jgi:hypothetical protein